MAKPGYCANVAKCLQLVRPGLLHDALEDLDPALEPLLSRSIVRQGTRSFVSLGNKMVPYNDGFRLYMACPRANPSFSAALVSRSVVVVNSTVTPASLEQHLMHTVVSTERRELERRKLELMQEIQEQKQQLKDIEDKILVLLYEAQGGLLEDETLAGVLAQSKRTSDEISDRINELELKEKQINQARVKYQPVAARATALYFCMADLQVLDPMYQFSLQWFIQLFTSAMLKSRPSNYAADPEKQDQHWQTADAEVARRVASLSLFFTEQFYWNVCRAMFQPHKLLFGLSIGLRIQEMSSPIDPAELSMFVNADIPSSGSTLPSLATPAQTEPPGWLSHSSWRMLDTLSTLPPFLNLTEHVAKNPAAWKAVYDSPSPWTHLEGEVAGLRFSGVHRLVLIRCLRPDRTIHAVRGYIQELFGPNFLAKALSVDIAAAYEECPLTTPLLIVLPPGVNPAQDIFRLAAAHDMDKRIVSVSLGQAQGPVAEKMIELAIDKGQWVLIQNCHVCPEWLPTLEKLVRELPVDRCNPKFRLFLTSSSTPEFPVLLMQMCTKVCVQPASGIKASLQRALTTMSPMLGLHPSSQLWSRTIFTLCLFHAVVQERCKFGALGWAQGMHGDYNFSTSDLQLAAQHLHKLIDLKSGRTSLRSRGVQRHRQEAVEKPLTLEGLEGLVTMITECYHGGRLQEPVDRTRLRSLVTDMLTDTLARTGNSFADSGLYRVPTEVLTSLEAFMGHINSIPDHEDDPQVLGLHPNALITYHNHLTKDLLEGLKTVRHEARTRTTITAPERAQALAVSPAVALQQKIQALLSKLPDEPLPQTTKAVANTHDPLHVAVLQEVQAMNTLLVAVRGSLEQLSNALAGKAAMAEELEELSKTVEFNHVPTRWARLAYLSTKPLDGFVRDLAARVQFFRTWLSSGPPKTVWISAFFKPRKFLTALVQRYARQHQLPLDALSIKAAVLKPSDPPPDADAVVLSGLFAEAGVWDAAAFVLREPSMNELYSEMPPIVVRVVPTLVEPSQPTPSPLAASSPAVPARGPAAEQPARGRVPAAEQSARAAKSPHVAAKVSEPEKPPEPMTYACPVYVALTRGGDVNSYGYSENFVMEIVLPCSKPASHWSKLGTALFCSLS
eukprot:TRINITY_DN6371_c0_g2_i1.p1 TRINITY_DN6371_c0_g2~~TRINITY_DN6371_c0_g2_i1.p1  ORF type:complete len:1126 (-),score=417.17 TRINITY_DN6371_c0_g2_i1:326-3703(-)